MTAAERARLIDQQEFEAECKAIRERAMTYAKEKQAIEARKVSSIIFRNESAIRTQASRAPINPNKDAQLSYKYQDKLMTIRELEELSGIQYMTLYGRLTRGWTVEKAINKPIRRIVRHH